MEEWVRKILENENLRKVEVKKIGNNYYAYSVSSVYYGEKRRPRKISGKYIGRITESGIIRKIKRSVRTVLEYENSKLIYGILQDIAAQMRK